MDYDVFATMIILLDYFILIEFSSVSAGRTGPPPGLFWRELRCSSPKDKVEVAGWVGDGLGNICLHSKAPRHKLNLFHNNSRLSIQSYLDHIFPIKNN